jgi:hypothetical protein
MSSSLRGDDGDRLASSLRTFSQSIGKAAGGAAAVPSSADCERAAAFLDEQFRRLENVERLLEQVDRRGSLKQQLNVIRRLQALQTRQIERFQASLLMNQQSETGGDALATERRTETSLKDRRATCDSNLRRSTGQYTDSSLRRMSVKAAPQSPFEDEKKEEEHVTPSSRSPSPQKTPTTPGELRLSASTASILQRSAGQPSEHNDTSSKEKRRASLSHMDALKMPPLQHDETNTRSRNSEPAYHVSEERSSKPDRSFVHDEQVSCTTDGSTVVREEEDNSFDDSALYCPTVLASDRTYRKSTHDDSGRTEGGRRRLSSLSPGRSYYVHMDEQPSPAGTVLTKDSTVAGGGTSTATKEQDDSFDDSALYCPTILASDDQSVRESPFPKTAPGARRLSSLSPGRSYYVHVNEQASPAPTVMTTDFSLDRSRAGPLETVLEEDDECCSVGSEETPFLDRYRLDADDESPHGFRVVPNARRQHRSVFGGTVQQQSQQRRKKVYRKTPYRPRRPSKENAILPPLQHTDRHHTQH